MPKPPIKFKEISLDDVPPPRLPSTRPSSNPRGSQWDQALAAIERGRGKRRAIQIVEHDFRKRNWLKATLQTMARKRDCFVEVRDDEGDRNRPPAVYAWASEKDGRFYAP